MSRLSVNTLRMSLAAVVLVFALSAAAAEKEKPAPLIGISKEQVYARLGEPRSQIKAGAREIMFFAKVKVTLRNNVVIETEELFDEPSAPPKRSAEPVAPTTATTAAPSDSTDAGKMGKSVATQTSAPAAATSDATAKPATAPAEPKSAAAPEAGGGLEIKFIRPPSANATRPTSKGATKMVDSTSAPAAIPLAAAVSSTAQPSAETISPPASTSVSATPSPTTALPTSMAATATKPGTQAEPTEAPVVDEPEEKPKPKPSSKGFFRRHRDPDSELPEVPLFTVQTFVFAFALAGAVAYLVWRRRQHTLELAATTVSNTPFYEPAVADTTAMFTNELLAKLEWKRFEELVASYYAKTGVIAARTKTGPESPAHLKISWKGEAKPFACVQCHASPASLIRVEPLQELFAALATADIRRGYVVTNGKFNVEARDFAEEKHVTLLPGDILLEKINALPPAARSELMQEVTSGDYATPSCPKCEAKMVPAGDGGWRCTKDDSILQPKKV